MLESRLKEETSQKSTALSELQVASNKCDCLSQEIEGLRDKLVLAEQINVKLTEELLISKTEADQLKESLRQSEATAEGYSEELRKQRDILSYINKISAENEALRRQSNVR